MPPILGCNAGRSDYPGTRLVAVAASPRHSVNFTLQTPGSGFSTVDILTISRIVISMYMFFGVLISGQQLFPVTLNGWAAVAMLAVICQMIGRGR